MKRIAAFLAFLALAGTAYAGPGELTLRPPLGAHNP